MKKALITGASGFIGSHCVGALLDRGYEVHAVSSREVTPELPNIVWHQCDLLDSNQQRNLLDSVQPSHLLHLAWYVVPGQLISSDENYRWVRASMDLAQAFAAVGGRRLVVCGSGYEYDWRYGYCSEDLTPKKPDTVYGACKYALSLMLESWARISGVSVGWGRVFFLYGPNEHPKRLVSSVICSLLRSEPAKCSHGLQIRDYMHVQDVANGLVALLDSNVEGPINISSAEATTIRMIVSEVGKLLNRPDLIRLGALPARANDVPLVVGANQRLTTQLDWKQEFELEAGLKQTIDWWTEQMDSTE